MKYKFSLFLTIAVSVKAFAQTEIPDVLKTMTDSFAFKDAFFNMKRAIKYGDTLGFGTGYYKNVFKIKTELDSFFFKYDPKLKPGSQSKVVHVTSPKGKGVVILSFEAARCWFPLEYVKAVEGTVQNDIPEIYELANVLYALTSSSASDTIRTLKNTPYYKEVLSYFARFKNHPLLKELEFTADTKGSQMYYNFRDNSFCFAVKDGKIMPNEQYYVVWGNYQDNLFMKHLELINDFYRKTNFHQFYQSHSAYYAHLKKTQQVLMPAQKMWGWLEKNFDQRFNSYRVVFSPLIKGSHGTQVYYWTADSLKQFREITMFTSGPRGVDADNTLTDGQKEGIASGILFTEIDHNYCNPVSERYKAAIDSSFANREVWVTKEGDGDNYPSSMAVFNEYMTHAVFLLYAHDIFNEVDFSKIRKERDRIMIEQRKYVKFKVFSDQLLELYKQRKPEQKVKDLYPMILAWCKSQN